tara:strand:+ start:234 stop:1067 length:834 start_codon:yes stop_codon:yes gene_type:complete
MKWFKHDTNANMDAKLQDVLLDYGLEGYGLYWYCIELISGKVDKGNITFTLEHDARIIARNVGSTPQKVQEMMTRFVDIGLFENIDGVITCMRIAKRLDQSMVSSPEMREIIKGIKSHDPIMTQSDKPMQDKNRLDQTRIDKNKDMRDIESAFDIFYSAGLVKKSKVKALSSFKSIVKNSKLDPVDFAETLKADIENRIKINQFGLDRMHPSTYLNQQRWTDEYGSNESDNGQAQGDRKKSAAERTREYNERTYGSEQPSGGLGLATNGGNIRGELD